MNSSLPISDDLFPALGFFGAHPNLQWVIPCGIAIKAIRLTVDSDVPTFLNLQRVDLWVDGQAVTLTGDSWSETLSSTHGSAGECSPRLLAGVGIHSGSERTPWWLCEFRDPIKLDEVRVSNRRDTWARRSQHLIAEIMLPDGRWVLQRRNHGADAVVQCLAELARQGVLEGNNIDLDISSHRCAWMDRLNEKLQSRSESSGPDPKWPQLLALVPIWGNTPLSDQELRLCANFILDQGQRGDDLAMTYLSAILKTTEQIDRLTQFINEIAAVRGPDRYMLTRHGLQRQGKLLAYRDRFLSAARKAVDVLDAESLKPIVAYGTLLGAVRSESFIAHDDDLDILCRINAVDPVSARAAMSVVIDMLNARGFEAKFSSLVALNVHAVDISSGALIDIFPYWVVGDQAFLHMERMSIRAISSSILHGTTQVRLYDQVFPAPADTEGFLLERYGSTWRVPLAHFEWPWVLDSPAKS